MEIVELESVPGFIVFDLSGVGFSAHGDDCVARYGPPPGPPAMLFTAVEADVLVPGTRPGVISRAVAEALPPGVRVVAPAANVPYTREGADVLRRRA